MPLRHALAAAALALTLVGCREEAPTVEAPPAPAAPAPAESLATAPSQAPDFTLAGPDGEFELAAQRGHVVLLTFWATWSEPSVAALDTVAAVALELAADDLVAVGVSQDEHGLEALRAWAADSVAGALVAVTLVSDSSHAVARQYGDVEMLPTTVVVDREGLVRARHVGVLSSDALLELIAPALIESGQSEADADVATGVQALEPGAVPELVAAGAALLDVREASARLAEGTLQYARHRPLPGLSREDLPANFAAPIVFLGGTLAEAREAAEQAAAWGYAAVYAVGGGARAWRRAGLEVVPAQPAPTRRRGVVG